MTLKLRSGVFTTDVEYGSALLDEAQGLYWSLNPSGALALQTMLAGGTAEQAAGALVEAYAVDIDTARQDVQELVHELHCAKLVEQ